MISNLRLVSCLSFLSLAALLFSSPSFASKIGTTPPTAPDPPSLCDSISGNIVQNCGFETGDFTDWTLGANTSYFGVATTFANTGSYGAYMGAVTTSFTSGNTLSQNLATVAGDSYTLSYWVENLDSGPDGFEVLWDGTVIPGSLIVDASAFGYTEYSFTVSATGSSSTLEFDAYQVPSYFGLDDITVLATTPEPEALLLLSISLIGLSFFGWAANRFKAHAVAEA